MVKVSIDGTDIYTGPGTNYPKTDLTTGEGIFTIMEIRSGPGSFLGWGRIKSGAGCIALDDVKPV